MPRRLRTATACLILGLALVAAACGRGDGVATLGEGTPDPAEATPVPEPLEGASCELQTGGSQDASMFLADVRIQPNPGYDRVIFDFTPREGEAPQVPYYRVEPATPPLREDGSGRELEVEGEAHIQIMYWATGVEIEADDVRAIYTGPKSFRETTTASLRELREAGDFENRMTWFAGTAEESCFRVRELADPPRLVVDIEDPALAQGGGD